MKYGFIIAAGNQTRFNSDTPKALSKVGDTTCLDINIKNMSNFCDNIYVVCSKDKVDYFNNYNYIAIDSGLGCGDAVLKALKYFSNSSHARCFIQWGDSISDYNTYKAIKNGLQRWSDIVVACRYEKNPYVRVNTDNSDKIDRVEFSKFNEVTSSGLHDLSLFYGKLTNILKYCQNFYNKFFDGNEYNHKHGKEFNFLDVFNDTEIVGNVIKLEDVKSYSFNTEEEYNKMLYEIGDNVW